MSEAKIGKKPHAFTEETRRRMSEVQKGKKPSIETRKKLSDALRGKKSHLWRGGKTPENIRLRHSVEYKLWREAVFRRDEYTCVFCGVKSGKGRAVVLNADHIKPFAYFPELRFAIDNGRTLCLACHMLTPTYKSKKKPI